MELGNEADSNYKTFEDDSEYFSVTDIKEEVVVQPSSRDNEEFVECREPSDYRSDSGRESSVEASLDPHYYRRSMRIRILNKKKSEMELLESSVCKEEEREDKIIRHKYRSYSKQYSRSSPLKARKTRRKKEKICPFCSKSLLRMAHLQRHIRSHTGEKPYKCITCSKSFIDLINLQRHTRSHTGERPYNCPHCFRNFSYPSDFKIHVRRHTGEKPYKCSTCPKCFCKSSDLSRHILTHNRAKS